MKVIRAGRLLTPDQELADVSVWIEGGRIVAVRAESDGRHGVGASTAGQAATDDVSIDASGLTVIPGLIDVHTHGADGVQAIDGTVDALQRMARFYARHGVTGFLAGVFGSREQIEAGIDAAVAFQDRGHAGVRDSRDAGAQGGSGADKWIGGHADGRDGSRQGARDGNDAGMRERSQATGAALLGIYLEGPFLNPAWAGAFVPDTIVPPDVDTLRGYLDRAEGTIRLLTLAPEVPGADALIELVRRYGVVCSLGHTDASFEQAIAAASRGVRHVAHTFNAMRGLHHREPGALGAALTDERFTVEIIADGVHVHPAAVRLLTRAKGADAVVLITDSIAAAGLPDGDYAFRDVSVRSRGGSARLEDGTLAGSTLTMERGIANLVAFGAATTAEAVTMGSTNPAKLLGLGARKGRVAVGHDADLVALTESFEVAWTMVGGELVYQA